MLGTHTLDSLLNEKMHSCPAGLRHQPVCCAARPRSLAVSSTIPQCGILRQRTLTKSLFLYVGLPSQQCKSASSACVLCSPLAVILILYVRLPSQEGRHTPALLPCRSASSACVPCSATWSTLGTWPWHCCSSASGRSYVRRLPKSLAAATATATAAACMSNATGSCSSGCRPTTSP